MGQRIHPRGVPIFVIMLAEALLLVLTDWGVPVRKSWSQSQELGCRPHNINETHKTSDHKNPKGLLKIYLPATLLIQRYIMCFRLSCVFFFNL